MSDDRYVFEPLGGHPRAAFSCGDEALDRYLQRQAGQDQRRNIASCFVLFDKTEQVIVGYYTLSATALAFQELPESLSKQLPRYPNVPGILLGRFAVDSRYQGRGFARRLLVDALRRARDVTSQVAAVMIIVDAKGEEAAAFYERFGFVRLEHEPRRLYLPVATLHGL